MSARQYRMRGSFLAAIAGVFLATVVIGAENAPAPVLLQYKTTQQDLYYLVERTFTWEKNQDAKNAETRTQRAIIHFGKSRKLSTGLIRLTPKVHLLKEEGKWKKLRAEVWPLKGRYPSGAWTDAWRWQVQVMARDYDMFPLFPETPVAVGETWDIDGMLRFGRGLKAPGKIVHMLEGMEEIDGRRCAKITYRFTGGINTAEHPELWPELDEIIREIKPAYGVSVEGVAYFDIQNGIVIRQEHHAKRTHRWANELDPKRARDNPDWRKTTDDIETSSISVR